MIQDGHGLHNFHRRKRIHQKHEPYPHPDNLKRFIDKAILFVCIAGPLMTIPQVFKIWILRNATGVSAISWGAYLVFAFFWLMYGILHKEKPIIINSSLWIILEALVVIGTLMYG